MPTSPIATGPTTNAQARLDAEEAARARRDRRLTHAAVLTNDEWSDLIDRWNNRSSDERCARAAVCSRRQHHDWVRVAGLDARWCRRCGQYCLPDD